MDPKTKRKVFIVFAVLVTLLVFVAAFGWYKFLREEPEQQFANEVERFKYGSIGAEFVSRVGAEVRKFLLSTLLMTA